MRNRTFNRIYESAYQDYTDEYKRKLEDAQEDIAAARIRWLAGGAADLGITSALGAAYTGIKGGITERATAKFLAAKTAKGVAGDLMPVTPWKTIAKQTGKNMLKFGAMGAAAGLFTAAISKSPVQAKIENAMQALHADHAEMTMAYEHFKERTHREPTGQELEQEWKLMEQLKIEEQLEKKRKRDEAKARKKIEKFRKDDY